MRPLKQHRCCLCLWAETVGYTGYLPTSATQCAAILQCWSRRAACRQTRSKLLARRPYSGGHWPGKKLNNVEEDLGKTSGRPREDILPLAPRPKLHFGKIPNIFGKNLAKFKFSKILAKFANFGKKNSKNFSNF